MRRLSRSSFCCCCLPLLVLCWFQFPSSLSGVNGDANSCNSSSFTQCANLGNNPFPFWGSASCAASPSYVLSNCTSSSTDAHWDFFSDAAAGVLGSPIVTSVVYRSGMRFAESYTSFDLTWNKSLADIGPCPPLFSSANLSLYNIPSSINLTRFADSSALSFSGINAIFLFGCAHNASDDFDVQVESSMGCAFYKALCGSLEKMPCVQLVIDTHTTEVLMLQHVLDTLACSHFMFGIPIFYQFEGFTQFTPAVFELLWADTQCKACLEIANGMCIYEEDFHQKFSQCECFNGTRVDFRTQSCDWPDFPDCYGGPLECNTGVKVGVGFGVGLAALVGVLGLCILIRIGFPIFIRVTVPVVISMLKKLLKKLQSISHIHKRSLDLLDLDGLTERPTEYSYGSLASATKSFNSVVGEGGFGTVYKGMLTPRASKTDAAGSEHVQQIAVKVLEAKSKHSKKQFLNEVVTIGKIHHVNVVRLLGFCIQEEHEMLVYEYVVNGSLDKWLFSKKGSPEEHVLDWGQRGTIALHEECRHRIVHCDIKPQNILLDAEMQPKIADFGLARLMNRDESNVMTLAKGTPGYMAPEFWRGGESQLSTKFDVYSYGMVLLELISGRRNFDAVAMASGSSFPAMAFDVALEGDLESIVDPRLDIMSEVDEVQKQVQWEQIKTVTFVALWCIQDHPASRPPMSEVVKYLEGGATVSDRPPRPTISMSVAIYPQQEAYRIGSYHDSECTPLSMGR